MTGSSLRPALAVFILTLAMALSLPATSSSAKSATWDQDRVTELSIQLAEAVHELQSALRREGPAALASGDASARHRFRDTLRVLRTETRALASELESGSGREETLPIVQRSRTLIRDLREDARRINLMEPSLGHAVRAEKVISELAPFYFEVAGSSGGE